MRFAPKHVVTMVACVSAAVVLAPVGVLAATGQLVNITDPYSSSRSARVSRDGSLRVESRTAVGGGTFNAVGTGLSSLSFQKLYEASGPKRIVITDITMSADSSTSQSTPGYAARIEVVALTRTSGSAACAYNAAGWTRKTVRWLDVAPTRTEQLTFPGSPIVVAPAASGHLSCVGYQVWVLPSSVTIFGAVGGYTYEP